MRNIVDSKDRLKLIIFDLDGTLVDAYPAIISSFNFTMQKLGYPTRSELVVCKAVGWGDENLLKPFIREKDLSKALRIYRQHHKESLRKDTKVLAGVFGVLRFLKRNRIKIAIASNRPTRFSWIIIRHLGLDKYVNYVLCADRIKYIKPHPKILNKIIQHFRVLPQETLYVGDMAIDAQAGRAAGIKTVIVTSGLSSSKKEIHQQKPFRIIGEINQLRGIIKQIYKE